MHVAGLHLSDTYWLSADEQPLVSAYQLGHLSLFFCGVSFRTHFHLFSPVSHSYSVSYGAESHFLYRNFCESIFIKASNIVAKLTVNYHYIAAIY